MPSVYKLDLVIIISAVLAFVLFLILHVLVFRWKKPSNVTREWILVLLWASLLQVFVFLALAQSLENSAPNLFMSFILSWVIFSFLAIGFVIIIFGASYSSIRIRLIQDLALHTRSITANELAKAYNTETILKLRLGRLLASHDLVQDGKFYCPSPQRNVFLWLNSIVNFLRKIYQIS